MMHTETIELVTKVLCDVKPAEPTDGTYLFAQTIDNQHSVLEVAAKLHNERKTKLILIPDSKPRCGYPGFDAWCSELNRLDVPNKYVIGVPTGSFESLNTYTEALATVSLSQIQLFSNIVIVATPFHQLRAFISIVSAVKLKCPSLKVFNAVGGSLPWYESVSHSQGILNGIREEFLRTELERIEKYQAKGDLISILEVLDYLRMRDKDV